MHTKKAGRRLLSLFLTLIMVLSMAPVSAFAAGEEDASSVLQAAVAELETLAQDWGLEALDHDLDLPDETENGCEVVWVSSRNVNTPGLTNEGVVKRPGLTGRATAGTLTATVYYQADSVQKAFGYTLAPLTKAELEEPVQQLLDSYLGDLQTVSTDLALFDGAKLGAYPTSTNYMKGIVMPLSYGGTTMNTYVTAASGNTDVIGQPAYSGTSTGKNGKISMPVTRQAEDTEVVLTFTVKASSSVSWSFEKTVTVPAAAAAADMDEAKQAAIAAFAAIEDYDGTNTDAIRAELNAALAAEKAAENLGWKQSEMAAWDNYGRIAAAQEILAQGNKTVTLTIQGYNKGALYPEGDGSETAYFLQGQPFVVGEDWTVYQVLKGAADLYGWTLGGTSTYVSSIAGLSEKMLGAYSGWMYMVNTTAYINVGMGSYKVSNGDNILIYYVKNYGSTPMCSFEDIAGWSQDKDAVDLLTGGDETAALESDWNAIKLALDANSQWNEDLPLPARGEKGSRVVWSSSDPSAVTAQGRITRGAEAQTVTLTAKLYLGDAQIEKTYAVTIGGTAGVAVTVNIVGKDEKSTLESWTGRVASFDLSTLDPTVTYTGYGNNVQPAHAIFSRLNEIEGFAFNNDGGLKSASGSYASATISSLFGISTTAYGSARKWKLRIVGADGTVRLDDQAANIYFGANLAEGDVLTLAYAPQLDALSTALTTAEGVSSTRYTEESYAALQKAAAAGQAEYAKGILADQDTADACAAAINEAVAALVPAAGILDSLPALLDDLQTNTAWTRGNGDGFGILALLRTGRTAEDEVAASFISGADTDLRNTSTNRPTNAQALSAIGMTALGTDLNWYIPASGTNTALMQMSPSTLASSQKTTACLASWLVLNGSGSYPEVNKVSREKVETRLLSFYQSKLSGWASSSTGSSYDIASNVWAVFALAPAYLDETAANHASVKEKLDASVSVLKSKAASASMEQQALIALALLRLGQDPEDSGLISGLQPYLLADGTGFSSKAYGTTYYAATPVPVLALVVYQEYLRNGNAPVDFLTVYSSYPFAEEKTALKAAISAAEAFEEENYTSESYAALTEAVLAGTAAMTDMNLTAAQVQAKTDAITAAAEALEAQFDLTALQALIEQAKTVDTDAGYSAESLETLAAALEYAESLSADNAAQADVNAAAEALQQALDGLMAAGEERIYSIIKTITDQWTAEKDTFTDDWRIVDMAILGRESELFSDTAAMRKYVSASVNRIRPDSVTDYERVLLAVTALGIDGTKLDEYRNFYDSKGNTVADLVAAIGAFSADSRSINGAIFALLAYDSGEYTDPEGDWSREALIDFLLENQLADGGWNLQGSGRADPDVTAMAVSALAPYAAGEDVSGALSRAMDCLAAQAGKKCTFASYGTENSNSSAMVMLALTGLGRDPASDSAFQTWSLGKAYNVLDGLLSFATSGNLFGYDSSAKANTLSTEQGLRALAAYRSYLYSGKAVAAYQFGAPDTPEAWGEQTVAVSITLNALPDKLTYEKGEAFAPAGIAATVTYSDGLTAALDASALTFTGFDSTTSGTRTVRAGYQNVSATFQITVSGSGSGSGGRVNYVYLRVADPKGKTYLSRTRMELEDGDTAFTLLGRAGLDYRPNFSTQYEGVYVEAIEGLAEFDEGAQSGWMYRVNGVFPSYSSSLYTLKAGDYVEWLYTRDLGKDLGDTYISGGGSSTDTTNEAADAVETLIGKIGAVTENSGEAITAARNAYDKLTEGQKKLVGNYDVLTAAEAAYAALTGLPFTDVAAGDWHYESVRYTYENALFSGTSATLFSPNRAMSRAMLATVLYRLEGKPEASSAGSFADVPSGSWYADAVAWAAENGIVKGVGENRFDPDTNVTREQMAAMMLRYAQYKSLAANTAGDLSAYTDAARISAYAKDAMQWANTAGLITGRTETTLVPQGDVTRAEAAAILTRFDRNIAN